MARAPSKLLSVAAAAVVVHAASYLVLLFIATPTHPPAGPQWRSHGATTLQARGVEYDASDADIAAVYSETMSGTVRNPPKGTVTAVARPSNYKCTAFETTVCSKNSGNLVTPRASQLGVPGPRIAPSRHRSCFAPVCAASTGEAATLPPERLIALSKDFLATGTGYYSPVRPELLSEDFIFRGGVVGPLNKKDYCRTMTLLGITKAFKMESNAFGFTVDPAEPMCVRFFLRNIGEHVGPWQPWGKYPALPIEPTAGRTQVIGPTETGRLIFNPDGGIKHFATGLVVGKYEAQQKDVNTNGVGAVLGLFHAVGVGPVGNLALSAAIRAFTNEFADLFEELNIPKTRTRDEEVPCWWEE